MDPLTATIVVIWSFNTLVGAGLVHHKLKDINQKLADINATFDSMDLSWRMPELSELDKEHRDGETA